MLERESLAAMIVATMLLLFLIALRVSLRWYAEKHLRVYSVHTREQLRRAYQAFFNTPS
jgi:ABC-type transport system involved in cytochrome bd biosynthesis fused ATPase/permease subunit